MSEQRKKVKIIYRTVRAVLAVFLLISLGGLSVFAEKVSPVKGQFQKIAYSYVKGIGDAPANTAEHFKHCCSSEYSYSMLKGDLRLTADDQIIMCHEGGFTLNKQGRIIAYDASDSLKVKDLTLEECRNLRYEKKYKGKTVKVCDFETYIKICSDNNKKAYITIRRDRIPTLIDQMMPILSEYGMESECVINSGALESLIKVREAAPSVRLSWVLRSGKLDHDAVDKAAELGNCVITLFVFPTDMFGGIRRISSYADEIAYAQSKGVEVHAAIVEDSSYIRELRKLGISGAQLRADSKEPVDISCGRIRITSVRNRTASLVLARNTKRVVIPPTVTIQGKTYRITTIGGDAFIGGRIKTVVLGKNVSKLKNNAFRGSRAKSLIITTKKLKRSNIKKAFRGSSLKVALIRVGSKKSNRLFAIRYRRLFIPRITGRKVKVNY